MLLECGSEGPQPDWTFCPAPIRMHPCLNAGPRLQALTESIVSRLCRTVCSSCPSRCSVCRYRPARFRTCQEHWTKGCVYTCNIHRNVCALPCRRFAHVQLVWYLCSLCSGASYYSPCVTRMSQRGVLFSFLLPSAGGHATSNTAPHDLADCRRALMCGWFFRGVLF